MTDAFVDTHLHCWDRTRFSYPWLEGDTDSPMRFVPTDLPAGDRPLAAVFMEADVAPGLAADEAAWAASLDGIAAVVAHAPLDRGRAAADDLDRLGAIPAVVAVRRLLQDEPAELLASRDLQEGVRMAGERGLVFDACVRDHQLEDLVPLVRAAPGTTVVLDHLGKPPVRAGWGSDRARAWATAIRRLAEEPSTLVKLSGMPPESAAGPLEPQVRPFVETALEAFGPARCVAGSDWPVSRTADAYGSWFALLATGFGLAPDERDLVLRDTAMRVYRLPGAAA